MNFARAIQQVDIALLQRSIRGEVDPFRAGHGGDGPALLVPGNDFIQRRTVRGTTDDFALASIIPSENPQTVSPLVIDDVMNVAYGARWKSMRYVPREAAIT